jgi:ssDNA-binding Zn-finger/Zn-ribbon topoisomerase 1
MVQNRMNDQHPNERAPTHTAGSVRRYAPSGMMSAAVARTAEAGNVARTKACPDDQHKLMPTTTVRRPLRPNRCPFLTAAYHLGGSSLVGCSRPIGHLGPHCVSAGGCRPGRRTHVPHDTPSMPGRAGDSLWPWDRSGQSPECEPDVEADPPALHGAGESCPTCGETDGGVLAPRRGRFGPFVGCNRYPDCAYIKKDRPSPLYQPPVEVGDRTEGDGRQLPSQLDTHAPVSLDEPECDGYHDGPRVNCDTLANAIHGEDAAIGQLARELVGARLDSLTGRDRRVLQLRLGLEDGRARTVEEVAREFNLTRGTIQRIEAKALRPLRRLAALLG